MKAIELLTPSMLALVAECSALDKLNHFLYTHDDCNNVLKSYMNGKDRWAFVSRKNQIAAELVANIHNIFHGRQVIVPDIFGKPKNITGIIEHDLVRNYEGRIFTNNVLFRSIESGNTMSGETIALWVNTGDKYTSHLYNIDKIEIV